MTARSEEQKLSHRFYLFAVENRLERYAFPPCVSNEFSTSLDCFRRALRNLLTRRVIYRRETFRVTGKDGFAWVPSAVCLMGKYTIVDGWGKKKKKKNSSEREPVVSPRRLFREQRFLFVYRQMDVARSKLTGNGYD